MGVIVAVTVASRRWARELPVVATERLRRAARTARRWRGAGLATGIVVAIASIQLGALGRGLLLAVPLCALCVLAGVVVGEVRISAPAGPVRTADLQVRRVRTYLPRRLSTAVGAATALLVVVLALTTATG